ncbi:putative serine/threonine-protein kinase PBL10 [Vitis vinifera]|uniref:Putative serine/threonine-protein kinase PBL10 n=1 Tax=Vitis vinifera TaxID=29760 RepID=A0A438C7U6_VITVI|nr:putative serine/threonine-protein kinase PBL10 [Vitis vinifera]
MPMGHLLAIVLLARALKEVNEVHIWEYASHAPALRPASQMKDEVLLNTLAFICGHGYRGMEKVNLIGRWIIGGLIGKLDEGEKIVCNLVNAFLLESSWNGDSVFVQMRGGKGLTKPPNDVAWEKANEVHLMNNKLSELPKSPDRPQLKALFLQINHHLRVIPTVFFEHMSVLQILDLSHTRIRSFPQSLSKLILEELVVERCPKINSMVTHEVPVGHRWFRRLTCLPKLKKLSLHYMPKLVSISSGVCIAPTLEWMSFYNCPSLQTLSDMEDIDLMTQLAEIGVQLLAPKQKRKPSQQSGSDGSVKALAVEEGTTLEEKQLYEPAPLSPFSIEEGGSIKAPTVDTETTSKEKQLYEPASLPFPTEDNDSMKAPAVEGGTTSEEKQLYEPVPLPFLREGGDFIKAPAVEAGTTLKETQLTEHAPSQRRKSPNLKNFTLAELKIATRNFRADGLLGEARKFTRSQGVVGRNNYLGQLYHPHIVKLIGFCSEDEQRLLVYEYMPQGSLENHIYMRGAYNEPLSWHLRLKVVLGAAKGLAFFINYNAKLLILDWPGMVQQVMKVMSLVWSWGLWICSSRIYSYSCSPGNIIWSKSSGQGTALAEQNLVEWAKPYLATKSRIFRVMDKRLEGQYSLEGAHKAASLHYDAYPWNQVQAKDDEGCSSIGAAPGLRGTRNHQQQFKWWGEA